MTNMPLAFLQSCADHRRVNAADISAQEARFVQLTGGDTVACVDLTVDVVRSLIVAERMVAQRKRDLIEQPLVEAFAIRADIAHFIDLSERLHALQQRLHEHALGHVAR